MITYHTLSFYVITFLIVQVSAYIYRRRTQKSWLKIQLVALSIWGISLYGSDSNKPDTPPYEPPNPGPTVRVYKLIKDEKGMRLLYDPIETAKKMVEFESIITNQSNTVERNIDQ